MLDLLLLVSAVVLCVPVGMFCLEVVVALVPRRARNIPVWPAGAKVTVLIPAHDEQEVIGETLRTLMPTLPRGSRVLVVADNCSDSTASCARQCGAEVIERRDAARRGKGFALDFGIQHLAKGPPDVVVFLDADCRVTPDTVRNLATVAIEKQQPVQGLNLCDPDKNGSTPQLVSGLAFRFKNLVRTVGLVRLSGLCHLTGTGMALPWSLVVESKLASGNVVEDMQLGVDLALVGKGAIFLPEARVDSPLPQTQSATKTQRTRWEHGHLRTLLTQAPRLFRMALRNNRMDLLWLALDLAIPPLSLLVMTVCGATFGFFVLWLQGASSLPLQIGFLACTSVAAAVLIGWAAYCRGVVPLRAIAAAPLYAVGKIPIYLAFLMKRQSRWIRTARDAGHASHSSTEYSVLSTSKERRPSH